MTLRVLLADRYAPVKGLGARSVIIYSQTIDRYRDFLRREPAVTDLEEDSIASFLEWRGKTVHCRSRGLPSAGTIRKDRSQLLALATYAFRKRLIPEFPVVRTIRKASRLPRGFTSEEVGRLITAARRRKRTVAGLPAAWWWSTILHAAWQTGARIGEILQVEWQDVSPGGEIIFRAPNRKGQTRDIARALSPELSAEIEQHRRPDGQRVWPWDRLVTSLYPSMRILCDSAGVPQRRFHAIRKASASYVAAAGGDASAHLDHSSATITRDYYLDDRVVKKIGGLAFLPPLDLGEKPPANKPKNSFRNFPSPPLPIVDDSVR
ncbi:XerC Integrase [uncultured Caudovirales phage]|uniref:Integrase n=1 Tax=uncultured Caudovirales phage TaxID=2100421 RepID=A0A6J5QSI7_9CAUD|nr:XerC Integrase [uncultured Caudovirales phage]